MNTTNAPTNLGGENTASNKQIKKLSLLLNDSDTDDNILKEGGDEGEFVDSNLPGELPHRQPFIFPVFPDILSQSPGILGICGVKLLPIQGLREEVSR